MLVLNLIFFFLVHKPQAVVGDIVLKLKALSKSMSKLNVRKEKCEIRFDMKIGHLPQIFEECNLMCALLRVGEMEVELSEAAVEKKKMRMKLFHLTR